MKLLFPPRALALLILAVSLIALLPTLGPRTEALAAADRYARVDLTVNGRDRYALVYAPDTYDGSQAVPLVLMFHGGGGGPEGADTMSRLSAKSEEEGIIAVFPAGNGRFSDERLLTWNSGNCCGYAEDQGIDDIAYVRALVAKLQGEYRIDPRRIYATGMSNGGGMAYRCAAEAADLFAAVAPVAAAPPPLALYKPTEPISILAIHGTEDQHVLIEGGTGPKSVDARVDPAMADVLDRWAELNGCASSPRQVIDGAITTRTWESCADGVVIEAVILDGGKHSWPGGDRGWRRGDTPFAGYDATDAIWEFFAAHPKG